MYIISNGLAAFPISQSDLTKMKLYRIQTDSRPAALAYLLNDRLETISHYARRNYPTDTVVELDIKQSKAKNWPKILYATNALSAIFIRKDLKELFDQFNGIRFFPAVVKNSEAKFLQPDEAPQYFWVKIEEEVKVISIVNEAGEELPFYEEFGETVYNAGSALGRVSYITVDRESIDPDTDFFYLDKICHTAMRYCTERAKAKLEKYAKGNIFFYHEKEDGRLRL